MQAQFLMNPRRLFICLFVICVGLVERSSTGCLRDDVVERFYYTPKVVASRPLHHEGDFQKEVMIIGSRVTWSEARALCSSYDEDHSENSAHYLESTKKSKELAVGVKKQHNVTLAIFTEEEEANWLAQMLSESNYRHEGMWIAGARKDKSSGWNWVTEKKLKTTRVLKNIIFESYPSWYYRPKDIGAEQNCLIFNRLGHDIPVFIPENCLLRRPFICEREARKKLSERISEGASITIDGSRYTLYSVKDNESGPEKLNGGGVTWKDARIECKKRGKHLATVTSIAATNAIADLMLKNRPSMENAWLGGWSLDGSEWAWVATDAEIPVTKSKSSKYPPWLDGHPTVMTKKEFFNHRSSRCLILDRHLCPQQISPVFLDLDCNKERPFICQDGQEDEECSSCEAEYLMDPRHSHIKPPPRKTTIDHEIFEFSEKKMHYEDAEDYCIGREGQIANILNSKILSGVLEKMSELGINHVWVGGRTIKVNSDWIWIDSNNKMLSPRGVGTENSWCFGNDENFMPKVEPNSCLNLDYEARGFPLFYGLPCNSTQIVLCSSHVNAGQLVELDSDQVDTRIFGNFNPLEYAEKAVKAGVNAGVNTSLDAMKGVKKSIDKNLIKGKKAEPNTSTTVSASGSATATINTSTSPSPNPSPETSTAPPAAPAAPPAPPTSPAPPTNTTSLSRSMNEGATSTAGTTTGAPSDTAASSTTAGSAPVTTTPAPSNETTTASTSSTETPK